MIHLITALLLIFTSQELGPPADTRFLDGLPDMPLPAYAALAEDAIIYDVPAGMIVRARLLAPQDAASVRSDMRLLLRSYGWSCGAKDTNTAAADRAVQAGALTLKCDLAGRFLHIELRALQGRADKMQTEIMLRGKPG